MKSGTAEHREGVHPCHDLLRDDHEGEVGRHDRESGGDPEGEADGHGREDQHTEGAEKQRAHQSAPSDDGPTWGGVGGIRADPASIWITISTPETGTAA